MPEETNFPLNMNPACFREFLKNLKNCLEFRACEKPLLILDNV